MKNISWYSNFVELWAAVGVGEGCGVGVGCVGINQKQGIQIYILSTYIIFSGFF